MRGLPAAWAVDQAAALARETRVHEERVGALIADLGGSPPSPAPPAGSEPGSRSELYARAFQAERSLLAGYRDLAALLPGPALLPPLAVLVAEEGRHLQRLIDLYRRYS